ncbi:conserved hypothetical protein [Tenacibaculum sp. 190130A14a]|uniref:ParB/Srx family N-terminal domain-containing protein n=1 Tax=Tenacibaculum polynesiense TaxID=3137857 RepID=UPI0031FF810D
MGKYNTWPVRSLSTERLRLDVENPRLPDDLIGESSQKEIIDYLVKNENVSTIAESIANKGYLHNEMPYVYKNSKGKFVVLEGNRRVTACKLLLKPSLAPQTRQRTFKNLSEQIEDKNEISKIHVILCPSREEADILIEARHTNNLLQSWDAIKKARFYYRKIKKGQTIEELQEKFSSTNIKKLLIQYFMYEEAQNMDFDENTIEKIRDEKKFKITNFERFYDKKSGRDFLGIKFKSDGTFSRHIPEEEYKKRFKFIVKQVLDGKINSRKLNTVEEVNDHVKKIFETGEFDIRIKPNDEINVDVNNIQIENENSKNTTQNRGASTTKTPRKQRTTLIPKDYDINIDNQRIIDVFDELQRLPLKNTNSIAFSFRSLLEMLCYQFLLKKGLIDEIKTEKLKQNQQEFERKRNKIAAHFENELEIELTFNNKLINVLGIGPSKVSSSPTLWAMLTYIVKNGNDFLSNPKLWNTISNGYLKNKTDDNFITHQGFNDLTHSEYKPSPKKEELIKTWDTLFPFLNLMFKELES